MEPPQLAAGKVGMYFPPFLAVGFSGRREVLFSLHAQKSKNMLVYVHHCTLNRCLLSRLSWRRGTTPESIAFSVCRVAANS
eukprot:scaffold5182_cov118-Skeletonema_dohrnii-CCMP3373.AAC.1